MDSQKIRRFCSIDPVRPQLNAPYSIGDFTYATNGHIIVRVPRLADVGLVDKAPVPKFFEALKFDLCKPWPGVALPAPDRPIDNLLPWLCKECRGVGLYFETEDHKKDGDAYDCPNCDGEGLFYYPPRVSVSVYGVSYNVEYIRWIMALPSISVPLVPHNRDAMPFTFDGGVGALMPCVQQLDQHIGPPAERALNPRTA